MAEEEQLGRGERMVLQEAALAADRATAANVMAEGLKWLRSRGLRTAHLEKELIATYNQLAVDLLREPGCQDAVDALLRSLVLCGTVPGAELQLAAVYNNLGCAYRQQRRPRAALELFKRADRIERSLVAAGHVIPGRGETSSNLCAAFSEVGDHERALRCAKSAVGHLERELQSQEPSTEPNATKLSVLGVAYYNLGVQLELLRRQDEALDAYERSLALSERHGSDAVAGKVREAIGQLRSGQQEQQQRQGDGQPHAKSAVPFSQDDASSAERQPERGSSAARSDDAAAAPAHTAATPAATTAGSKDKQPLHVFVSPSPHARSERAPGAAAGAPPTATSKLKSNRSNSKTKHATAAASVRRPARAPQVPAPVVAHGHS